jgi:hypothetical protein
MKTCTKWRQETFRGAWRAYRLIRILCRRGSGGGGKRISVSS